MSVLYIYDEITYIVPDMIFPSKEKKKYKLFNKSFVYNLPSI